MQVARLLARGIKHEFLTRLQQDAAFGKLADADFGALQVGHDGDFTAGALGRFTHQLGPVHMVLRLAVAEVQPHHIDTGADHFLQQDGITGSRSEGGNDLGGAKGHGGLL